MAYDKELYDELLAIGSGKLSKSEIKQRDIEAIGAGRPQDLSPKGKLERYIRIQNRLYEGADKTSGAPTMLRYIAGKQFSPKGVARYLGAKLGPENVFTMLDPESGEIDNFLIRDKPEAQWRVFDPSPGHKFWTDIPGDIADVSGDTIEGLAQSAGAAGGALLGSLTGNPVGTVAGLLAGSGAAGTAANLERQAEVAALPGSETISPLTRGRQAIEAGGVATLSEGVGVPLGKAVSGGAKLAQRAGSRVFKKGRYGLAQKLFGGTAPETAAEALGKVPARRRVDVAREGLKQQERLSEKIGEDIAFSAGELGKSPKAQTYEAIVRTDINTMEGQQAIDLQKTKQLTRFADKTIDELARGEIPAIDAVDRASKSHKAVVDNLYDILSKTAKKDFGLVDEMSGNKNVFGLKNAMDTIDSFDNFEKGAAGGASKELRDYLQGLRNDFMQATDSQWSQLKSGKPVMNARAFQRTMHNYGVKVREGTESATQNITRQKKDRINKAIFAALNKDLDESVDTAGSKALRTARENYRVNSKKIDAVQDLFFDRATDMLADDKASLAPSNLLRQTPEKLEKITSIIRQAPDGEEVVDKLSGSMLREVVDSASSVAGGGFDEAGFVSPARLGSAITKKKKQLSVMLGNSERGRALMQDLFEFADRVKKRPTLGGTSRTEPMQRFASGVEGIARSPGTVFQAGYEVSRALGRKLGILHSPETLFKALNDPDQIKIMLELVGPRSYERPIEETSRLVSRILSMQARVPPEQQAVPAEDLPQ
jgi:hypothetical protein